MFFKIYIKETRSVKYEARDAHTMSSCLLFSVVIEQSPEISEGVSHESAGAVSPEFLKKLEEWERLKSMKGK